MGLLVLVVTMLIMSLALWIHPLSRSAAIYAYWSLTNSAAKIHGVVEIRDAKIAYRCLGRGSPLVFLHGGLSSSVDWFSQVPYFAARNWRIILVDTRGHGTSTMGNANFTYEALADDVIAVLDHLGVGHADFVGWSDGGNVALQLSRKYPARVRRMVLISANYSPAGLKDPELIAFDDGWMLHLKRYLFGSGSAMLAKKVQHLWANHPQLTPTDLRTIKIPTLVIIGENDLVSLQHAGEMATALPASELRIVAGAGHHSLMTHADELNGSIERFLTRDRESRWV